MTAARPPLDRTLSAFALSMVVAVVAVVAAALLAAACGRGERPPSVGDLLHRDTAYVAATFAGSGATTTRPFVVGDRWALRWKVPRGGPFSLALNHADGSPVSAPVYQPSATAGESYQPAGGEYLLEVNAQGPWTIEVVQLP